MGLHQILITSSKSSYYLLTISLGIGANCYTAPSNRVDENVNPVTFIV
jgi:hypothetical protein